MMFAISRRLLPMAGPRSRRLVADGLVHCADPVGPRTEPPRRRVFTAGSEELVVQADLHGVLPALLRHFHPSTRMRRSPGQRAQAQVRHRSALAYAMMLRKHGEALMAAARLPVVMVKGRVFARTIY